MEIKELQEIVKDLKAKRDNYDEVKRHLDVMGGECDVIEHKLLEYLQENDMKSFRVDGVALVSVTEKMAVKTPKTIEDKDKFFAWLKENKGEEVMKSYMTVNAQSLNSFFKQEWDMLSDDQKLTYQIDGLEAPAMSFKLSVRKA
jgi:hypothetical protein